ncbi:MAG: P-loop NTPase fold protein [Parcubacteria group bacterium]
MANELNEIWTDDLLGRRSDAELLIKFLLRRFDERQQEGQSGAYVVNLNAAWGHGKTFFLERLKRHIEAQGHLCTYVNGWRDDGGGEPLIAVMASIEETLSPFLAKEASAAKLWRRAKSSGAQIMAAIAKGAAKKVVSKVIGDGVHEVIEIFEGEPLAASGEDKEVDRDRSLNDDNLSDAVSNVTELLDRYLDSKLEGYLARVAAAESFKVNASSVLEAVRANGAHKLPYLILIDELDRCRPTYAIEMLEQVKHLFDIDGAIFLIATDGDQLSHSVSAVYGNDFDSKRYLLRFFNRHYRFERRDLYPFVTFLFKRFEIDRGMLSTPFGVDPVEVFVGAMRYYEVTLRDAEQCFDLLRTVVTLWDHKVPIELTFILPLIIFFQRHDLPAMMGHLNPEVMDNRSGDAGLWQIKAKVSEGYGRSVERNISVPAINAELRRQMTRPIPDVLRENPRRESPVSQYAYDVLTKEFTVIHRNAFTGSGPLSILNKYGDVVRSVGRFTPEGEGGT